MEFTFKDKASKEFFESRHIEESHDLKTTKNFTEDDINDLYQELIDDEKKVNILKEVGVEDVLKVETIAEINEAEFKKSSSQDLVVITETISRVESKQDSILKLLTDLSSSTINQT